MNLLDLDTFRQWQFVLANPCGSSHTHWMTPFTCDAVVARFSLASSNQTVGQPTLELGWLSSSAHTHAANTAVNLGTTPRRHPRVGRSNLGQTVAKTRGSNQAEAGPTLVKPGLKLAVATRRRLVKPQSNIMRCLVTSCCSAAMVSRRSTTSAMLGRRRGVTAMQSEARAV